MDDVPRSPGGMLYVVERGQRARWIVMACPCGCGERIEVNLSRARHPAWEITPHGDAVSLYPSLWVSSDKCGSHFWIRDNRVLWV
jgi:hypothetical protein